MKALIIGASGATGNELVKQLSNDADFKEVHLFVRNPDGLNGPKIHVHTVDFEHQEQWRALVSGDVAFSCLGTTRKAAGSKEAQYKVDVDYQFNFAEAAKANGVDDFILVSSYGADSASSFFYSKMKGVLEEKVKQLHFNKLTIFQPGMLDRENSDRSGELIGAKLIKLANKLGLFRNQKPLPTSVLATAMITAAKIKSNGISEIKLGSIFSFARKNV